MSGVGNRPRLELDNEYESVYNSQNYTMRERLSTFPSSLSYGFKFQKQKIKEFNKKQIEEYLYDLNNTWNLDMELIKNTIHARSDISSDLKKMFINSVERLKNMKIKKENFFKEQEHYRGKLLMDKQILEEYKRKKEENINCYEEQIKEIKENLEKKDFFIKQFEKKFNEVQIYVQREAKLFPEGNEFKIFEGFEILKFINNFNNYKRKIAYNEELIAKIKNKCFDLHSENIYFPKRDIESKKKNLHEKNTTQEESEVKFKRIFAKLESKINLMLKEKSYLDSCLRKIKSQLLSTSSLNIKLNKQIKEQTLISPLKMTHPPFEEQTKNMKLHTKYLNENEKLKHLEFEKTLNFENSKDEENISIDSNTQGNSIFGGLQKFFKYNSPILHKNSSDIKDIWNISCIDHQDNI